MHIYRRHSKKCKHRSKGETYYGCKCPIWIRGVVNGIAIREALSTRDWGRASKLMATREQELADGNISKRIGSAIEAFVNSVDGEPSTIKKYWRILGYFAEFCKANHILTVDEVTTEDMDKYQLLRKPTLSPLTWQKEFDVCRAFFRFCENRDWCRKSPMRFMKPPRNPKPKDRRPYTPEEFIAILSAADRFGRQAYDRTRAKAMLLLMYHYGLRIGDVAFFRRDSIRGNEVTITAGKNKRQLWFELHPDVRTALDRVPVPKGSGVEGEYYFWSGNGSKDSHQRSVARTLSAIFKQSGVEGAIAHRFRHSLTTEILTEGGTIEDAANVLGDSPATIRKHYAKLDSRYRDRLSGVLRGVRGTSAVHLGNEPESGVESILGVVARDGIDRLDISRIYLKRGKLLILRSRCIDQKH